MSLIRNRFSFIPTGGGGGGTASLPFSDVDILLGDDSDPTKQLRFELASISSGQTRVLTVPNKSGVIACTDDIPSVSGYLTKTQFEDLELKGMLKDGTLTSIAFDGTNTFTLTDLGAGWSYYINGIKYSFTGNRTVVLAGTPVTTGFYYFYFDDTTGVLKSATSVNIDLVVLVATVCFNDSLTPKYWLADERHAVVMDRDTAHFIHSVIGAKLSIVPELSGYTLNTDTDTSKTFAISEGELIDQDLTHTLTALPDPNGTATDYVVCYRTGASTWAWKKSDMPFAYNIGNTNNTIQYDNAGTMTDCNVGAGSNRRYVCSYLLGTNIVGDARYHIIMGRNQYTTLLGAQTEDTSTFTWDGLPIDEQVIIYKLIWDTTPSTSKGLCVLTQVITINQGISSESSTSIQHNSLLGLQGGTASEYYHLSNAQVTKLDAISGTNTGDQNIFSTIAVSGQSNVVADSTTDTLTLAAGSNITLTTDASTDTITIASTGGSSGDINGVVETTTERVFFDSFLNPVHPSNATTTTTINQWFRTLTGTGTTAVYDGNDYATYVLTTDRSLPKCTLDTGTTTTGRVNITNSVSKIYQMTETLTYFSAISTECYFRLEDLSDGTETYTFLFGFAENSGGVGAPTTTTPDGITLTYTHNVNSGSLVLRVADGTATTTNLTHTALAADTWYKVKILYTFGTDIKIYLDDTLIYTETTLTNISTSNAFGFNPAIMLLKSAGTTPRKAYISKTKTVFTKI